MELGFRKWFLVGGILFSLIGTVFIGSSRLEIQSPDGINDRNETKTPSTLIPDVIDEAEAKLEKSLLQKLAKGRELSIEEEVILSGLQKPRRPTPEEESRTDAEANLIRNELDRPAPLFGLHVFDIFQNENADLVISKVVVNEMAPAGGEEQSISVEINESLDQIGSVEAVVVVDGKEIVVPLQYSEVVDNNLYDRKYAVVDNKLVILEGMERYWVRVFDVLSRKARATENSKVFKGTHVINGAYDRIEEITIRAVSKLGGLVKVTLAANQHPCGIPIAGDWTTTGNCIVSALDGVQGGSMTVSNGHVVTIPPGSTFIKFYNVGQKGVWPITVTGTGSIAITGGSIIFAEGWEGILCITDADGDAYTPTVSNVRANYTSPSSGSCPAGTRSRGDYAAGTEWLIDCNDASASVYPGSNSTCANGSWGSYTSCQLRSAGSFGDACSGVVCSGFVGNKCRYRSNKKCDSGGSGSCNQHYYYEEEVVSCANPLC